MSPPSTLPSHHTDIPFTLEISRGRIHITTKNKANKIKKPSIKPKEGSLVAEDIIGSAGIVSTEKKLGETVLVPGLTRMTEEVFSAKPESKKVFEASFGNDEAEDPDVPEKNQEHEKQEETKENRANEAGEENLQHDRSDSYTHET